MFSLIMPNMENVQKQSPDIKISSYSLYSSIFETVPKLSFSYEAAYITPDALNLFIGSSFPIRYQFAKKISKDEISKSEIKDLAGMVVSEVEMENSSIGTKTTVVCEGEFEFFQNSNIRKAYSAKYGNDVVNDILDLNNTLKSYNRKIEKTDNATTVYRALGDSDIEFAKTKILSKYTISNGQPLLFTSLDRTVNFTSVNNLLESNQKSKILINWPGLVTDSISKNALDDKLKSYLDDKSYTTLDAAEYKFNLGYKGTAFNLQNAVYYTSYENNLVTTNGYVFKPALNNVQYFPVDKFFTSFSKATQAVASYNRPSNNIVYESRNYFNSFENLITIHLKVTDIDKLEDLVLAGDLATVITAYPYSVYNGNYLVAEVEYGQDVVATFMELTLIRPTVDFTWQDLLTNNKESDEFKFKFAPNLQRNSLYSI